MCRQLARWAATAMQRGERVPDELIDATRRLAETIRPLHRISRTEANRMVREAVTGHSRSDQ